MNTPASIHECINNKKNVLARKGSLKNWYVDQRNRLVIGRKDTYFGFCRDKFLSVVFPDKPAYY